MIVKRNRPEGSKLPRKIVRRSRQSVGQNRPRMIVKRSGGVRPPVSGGGTGFQFPTPGRGWLLAVAVASLLVMVGSGTAWVWQSPLIKVTNVEVAGNERVATDIIVVRTQLLGQNMFTADLAAAQKELYQMPLVHSVRIERRWPNTLRIQVEERKAWGTWEQNGVRYSIDRDGVVLGTVPPPPGSPVIRSSEIGTRLQGDRVNYQAVDAAAEIYEQLPRQLGTTVMEVAYLAGKGLQVTTANGDVALLGDSSSIAYKLAVWAALAREAQIRGINYTTIDLRYGNRPVLQ
jgi:cell division protein FtsQ